ncbi:F-box associated domain [Trema orientale]|uniref:F-box associated domain n=1 Tax=Trema orientale TaxID=63057 RepID=A0A2P5G0B8_TREOI|nr:F-box associated domain [Trema orientale]
MILSFDMCDEKFQRIPLPDEVQRFGAEWRSLAVWNESLVLFFSAQNSWFSTSFEMWVMLDIFGADEGVTPWIKHLTVGPLIGIHSPVAFWNDDELLMDTRDGGILSYNLSTQEIRRLPIHGAVVPGSSYADFFQRSLVSVKGGNVLNQLAYLDL